MVLISAVIALGLVYLLILRLGYSTHNCAIAKWHYDNLIDGAVSFLNSLPDNNLIPAVVNATTIFRTNNRRTNPLRARANIC